MGEREGGDDFDHLFERGHKGRRRLDVGDAFTVSCTHFAENQHRWQQQGKQKEDMVVTNPDVKCTLNHVLFKGLPRAGRLEWEFLRRSFCTQNN